MSAQSRVLRNVAISERPHALVRPGGASAAQVPLPPSAEAPVAVAPPPPPVDLQAMQEDAFRRGREQGRQEGLCEAFDAARAQAVAAAREQGLREGREAGHEAGRDAAQVEARAAVQATLDTLERLLAALPQRFEMRLAAHEEDMVALCFETVARILGQEAAAPDGLRQMLRKTLAEFGPRRLVEVRVHPGDVQCLAGDPVVAGWLREREDGAAIQIVADPGVELGGIVLRSPSGRLDARLDHQLEALRGALLATRAARAAAPRPAGPPTGART
jgi:flagellar assembly protein FliH